AERANLPSRLLGRSIVTEGRVIATIEPCCAGRGLGAAAHSLQRLADVIAVALAHRYEPLCSISRAMRRLICARVAWSQRAKRPTLAASLSPARPRLRTATIMASTVAWGVEPGVLSARKSASIDIVFQSPKLNAGPGDCDARTVAQSFTASLMPRPPA